MPQNRALQDLLDQYKKGDLSIEAAAEAIEGLRLDRIGDFACMDLGRDVRCGMPEVVLAEGKDPAHLATNRYPARTDSRALHYHQDQ